MKLSTSFLAALILAFSSSSIAQNHTSLDAHAHGVAKLAIALEKNNKISIDLEMPGDSAVGFEHAPKTPAEIAAKKNAEDTFKEKFSELITFPENAKCVWGNPKIEVNDEAKGHSDWDVQIVTVCQMALEGQSVSVNFGKYFASIDKLEVSVIGQDFQKKVTLKKGSGSLSLTR